MDEETAIIDSKNRNERVKNFLIENKKLILSIVIIVILILTSFFSYKVYRENIKEKLSDKYNSAIIDYENNDLSKTISIMKEIVKDKDNTYSPLALYFLIDNDLVDNKDEVNELFNILINQTSLEFEIKNLIIYKKALYNANSIDENDLLKILNPLINSESSWKSHALYLIAEYFYSKNEKEKSKEFFDKIINTKNANQDIIKEAQKRLIRDLSE